MANFYDSAGLSFLDDLVNHHAEHNGTMEQFDSTTNNDVTLPIDTNRNIPLNDNNNPPNQPSEDRRPSCNNTSSQGLFYVYEPHRNFHALVHSLHVYELLSKDDRDKFGREMRESFTELERRMCKGDVHKRHSRDTFRFFGFSLNKNSDRIKLQLRNKLSQIGIGGLQCGNLADKFMIRHVDMWYEYTSDETCEWNYQGVSLQDVDDMLTSNTPLDGRLCRMCAHAFLRLNRHGLCPDLFRDKCSTARRCVGGGGSTSNNDTRKAKKPLRVINDTMPIPLNSSNMNNVTNERNNENDNYFDNDDDDDDDDDDVSSTDSSISAEYDAMKLETTSSLPTMTTTTTTMVPQESSMDPQRSSSSRSKRKVPNNDSQTVKKRHRKEDKIAITLRQEAMAKN